MSTDIRQVADLLIESFDQYVPVIPALAENATRMTNFATQVFLMSNQELILWLRRDPSLPTLLLRLANSTFYRHREDSLTLQNAIVRVGRQDLSDLVMSVIAKKMFAKSTDLFKLFPRIWQVLQHHFVFCGLAVARLCRQQSGDDLPFLAGMFHDIGYMVGLVGLSYHWQKQLSKLEVTPPLIWAVLEAVHCELGGRAVERWELPSRLVYLVKNHHHDIDEAASKLLPQYLMLNSRLVSDFHLSRQVSDCFAHKRSDIPKLLHGLNIKVAGAQEEVLFLLSRIEEHVYTHLEVGTA